MRLSWNEIRARAAEFAREWAGARYERGEAQSFYNDFFSVFDVKRRQVATFEEPVKRLGDRQGYIDLFWKGVLLVEQKSAGGNLTRAKEQALGYFPGLKPYELPRYVLVSDFQTFELHDLESDEPPLIFALADLPRHVERFGFIVGVERRTFRDQDPANVLASELMAKLHDALKESGYAGHDLERYLVRLLFCLFADDTGIFPRDAFETLFRERTAEDGSDLGLWLAQLWEVLDCDPARRQRTLDEDLQQFDYINGQLFSERLPIASFNAAMRARLLDACGFGWDAISPAIFGALFQAVMKPAERRKKGAHYTTERNILKVIQPLFLDDLRAEFERLKARRDTRRRAELEAFHERLAALRFFDPACGCGNFLVIAYRELRELETAVLAELHTETFNRPGLSRSDFNFDVGSLTN
ncbi:MAG: type IIL restriction-modification enzyme MmeI [Caulobacteraceae bacterium]